MSLSAGTRLGPYEVLSAIGQGGMGQVYKARDTRLDRIVAVKVLPPHLASDLTFRERFEREAKSISSLNHPNICTLHDVGQVAPPDESRPAVHYLVMEYLEGETLAARIARGPLPFAVATKIAMDIAAALETAHARGVVHRDLKPGNVMLIKAGAARADAPQAKLLDFGLAKVELSGVVSADTAATMTAPLTGQGAILGTLQYMAPEQIEGTEADARTDLFAFGLVLYEMLTGQKAFVGKTNATLMSAILRDEPAPVSQLRPAASPALDYIVRGCLTKDRSDRFHSAHDLLLQLRWIAEGGGTGLPAPTVVSPRRRLMRVAIFVAAGLAAVAAGGATGYYGRTVPVPRVMRFSVPAPDKTTFGEPMAVSPDGRSLAFLAEGDGKTRVWIRALDSMTARPLPGTDGAGLQVFWSPNNVFVGFFADGQLKKVPVAGGPVQTVCEATLASGGAWGRGDVIVFAAGAAGGLSRVAATGGTPAPLTTLDASRHEVSHRWPAFLPDGRHVLYIARGSRAEDHAVFVVSLDDPTQRTLVLASASNAVYSPPGFLLFVRDQTLMAQRFNARRLTVEGDAFPVAEGVGMASRRYMLGMFSASDTGVLAYGAGTPQNRQLAWFDRRGKEISRIASIGQFGDVVLSRDGKRAAVTQTSGTNDDLWTIDLARGLTSRLTSDPALDQYPVWGPGDAIIAFYSSRGAGDIYEKLATGVGTERVLLGSALTKAPSDWSHDGKWLLYSEVSPKTKPDLFALPLVGDRQPIALLQTEFGEGIGRFSPDDRWIAYQSSETGRTEIYVQSFPISDKKAQISTSGGSWPRWRADGSELFYLAPDRKLMAVPVVRGAAAAAPVALFDTQVDSYAAPNRFDVSADGQRFLVNVPAGAPVSSPLTVVTNWTLGLNSK